MSICKACGGYAKPHYVDGYCGQGCDIAFEAGKAEATRATLARCAAEARRRAAETEAANPEGDSRWHGRVDAFEAIAAWCDAAGRETT